MPGFVVAGLLLWLTREPERGQQDAGAAGAALIQSLDNPLFADYSRQLVAGSEQAYLESGYEPNAAAGAAMFALTMPRAGPLMEVSKSLLSLQQEFIRSADFDAAEPTVIIGLTLGQRIQALVGGIEVDLDEPLSADDE